ncbi:MAG TPA: MBL fold metallo-hydrolase [Caulobacteraceae bacterium]|jgi:glyoxylase-like metal-dependent hydrolase (beta-lactamase superfamily II)|nr:MBL fold metallo-hydrolase [Caulobacteraceae bacterium]
MTRCAFHILKAGACRHPAASTRVGASLKPAIYPALAGLILHPNEGAILFDTGYDPAFFAATLPFPERLYRWTTPVDLAKGEAAADQLPRFGLTPRDIRAVVVSHFHGDHVAGLHAFPQAALYCSRAGLAEVKRPGRIARVGRGVLAALAPDAMTARARFFEDLPRTALGPDLMPFESGADLFGDGSLIAVELPGHCPGHWGLVLRDETDQLVFLVADAAWSRAAVRDDAPPPPFTTGLLGHTETYRKTLADLHGLWTRNPELRLTPSHCPEAAAEASVHGD